jgi:HlyD family secretion protein
MSTLNEHVVPKQRVAKIEHEDDAEQLSKRVRSLRLPSHTAEVRGRSQWVAWIICAVFAVATAVLCYLYFRNPVIAASDERTEATKPAASQGSAGSPANEASSGEFALQAKGYIITAHQILVSPKVSGMIVELNIIESKRVEEGDILAKLEDTFYLAEQARANASLVQADVHLSRCVKDHDRAVDLLKTNAISHSDFDLVEGNRKEAEALVELAKAELAKAQWQLDNCVIRAPISGTILKKNAEKGSLVNPIAMQGFFSLCEMADLSDLEVDLTIQEREISRIFKDQPCKVRAEAYPDRLYEGYVSRLMPTADRAKGAIPVRVKVAVPKDEEGVYLKPEMGALVSFLKQQKTESDIPKPKNEKAR